jgi:hypothetical protein
VVIVMRFLGYSWGGYLSKHLLGTLAQ